MSTDTISCEHGQLARSCEVCELRASVAELKAENYRLRTSMAELTAEQIGIAAESTERAEAAEAERDRLAAKIEVARNKAQEAVSKVDANDDDRETDTGNADDAWKNGCDRGAAWLGEQILAALADTEEK